MVVHGKRHTGLCKRGNVYWARFRVDGELIQESLSTDNPDEATARLLALKAVYKKRSEVKKNAEKFASDQSWNILQRSVAQASATVPPEQDALFSDVLDAGLFVTRGEVKDEQYNFHVRSISSFKKLTGVTLASEFTSLACIQYLRQREREVCPKTARQSLGSILKLFDHARMIGVHKFPRPEMIPFKYVPGKERRALTVEEIGRLLEATKRPQERVMWLTALKTGMRKGEFTGLKWKHLQGNEIVLKASETKNGKTRVIPLADGLLEQLRAHKEHRDYVFVNTAGNPWRNNLLTRFYVRCKEAGIPDAHPKGSVDIHALRTTFISHVIAMGCDPRSAQSIVGHSTTDLTLRVYARVNNKACHAAVNMLGY